MILSLTDEQRQFVFHDGEAFVKACPGAGKTRAIIGRISLLSQTIPPRKGIAVLSFTNTAVNEFKERCNGLGLDNILKFPSFVGTFDAFVSHFIVMPLGIPGVLVRPIILDSWKSLGIEIRLQGNKAFQGSGISLDRFDPSTGAINPDTIGQAGLKAHVKTYKADYEKSASSYRQNLRRKGFLSAADARVVAMENLEKEDFSANLGGALAARFEEVIVDEAQDCNPLDLRLLEWLRQLGVPVTIVCDSDQAIYGFRHGNPVELHRFASMYEPRSRLQLCGNFRSSSPICSLAATLRSHTNPDNAIGENAEITTPVHILAFKGKTVPSAVGQFFTRLAESAGVKPDQAFILSHKRRAALQAAGLAVSADSAGNSKVALIAGAVGKFWSSSGSNRERETALCTVEKQIMQLMRKIGEEEPVSRAVEQNGIDKRWLRRAALALITRLPKNCKDTDDDRSTWLAALHREVCQLCLEYGPGITVKRFYPRPTKSDWNRLLDQTVTPGLRCATVHEAKGREYEAVCLVIPPNRRPDNHTEQVFTAWEERLSDEALRVVYVGITRAKKLAVIALPTAYRPRLENILNRAGVTWELQELV